MSGWTKTYVDSKLRTRRVIVFGKSTDPDSQRVKRILENYSLSLDSYEWIDIEKRQDCRQVENYLRFLGGTDRRQTPYIFIAGLYFGSLFELNICHQDQSLKPLLSP